jgi:transmembrane sensor
MNAQIQQEAAEWLIELQLDEPDAPLRERFVQWLRASPEHVRAYLELVTVWDDARHYDSNHEIDVNALVSLARADANVVAFQSKDDSESPGDVAEPQTPPLDRRAFWTRRIAGISAAAATIIAVSVGLWFWVHLTPTYATDVGEQRTVKLADGSIAELNAVSRIRVRYSGEQRIVDLLQGEALFRVAKNKSRPFIVVSSDTRVRAVGTEFDVNRKPTGTVVTVVEGRVAVLPQSHVSEDRNSLPAVPLEVAAGEQIAVHRERPPSKSQANVAAATAWTQQQLIFESTPLLEVAEEFNRFNNQKLIVDGSGAREMRISGNFPALDPTSLPRFVRFLREQHGMEISESPEQILVRAK